jgi:hypothetical protein
MPQQDCAGNVNFWFEMQITYAMYTIVNTGCQGDYFHMNVYFAQRLEKVKRAFGGWQV